MTECTPQLPVRSLASRIASAALVVVGGLFAFIPILVVTFVVPRFEEIFHKFNIPDGLSPLTETLIGIGHVLGWCWFVVVPMGLLGVGYLAVVCARPRTRRGLLWAVIFAGASFVIVSVLVTIITIGLFQPLTHLIKEVNNR
jgi:type II secretory pathway component PulF